MNEHEEWRPVAGFPLYEVSNQGQVRRVGRRILKAEDDGRGYRRVYLSRNPRGRRRKVHHLVLEAFVGPCPDGMVCRHLNGNRSDNRVGNLRWGTHAQNQDDKIRHGTLRRGEQCPTARLTEVDVREIFRLWDTAEYTRHEIGVRFGITASYLSDILYGRSWGHVTPRPKRSPKSCRDGQSLLASTVAAILTTRRCGGHSESKLLDQLETAYERYRRGRRTVTRDEH